VPGALVAPQSKDLFLEIRLDRPFLTPFLILSKIREKMKSENAKDPALCKSGLFKSMSSANWCRNLPKFHHGHTNYAELFKLIICNSVQTNLANF